jgi:hypothetical protein
MLNLHRESLLETARETGWDLNGQIERVYEAFRFRNGRAPKLVRRSAESRPAIQQALMDCNADLGARERVDWPGFIRGHRELLKRLAPLPRLGRLGPDGIDRVCDVVAALEDFKDTAGRKLVFGSKAAHFHFPWLVPAMSIEVEAALREIDRVERTALDDLLPGPGRKFLFSSPTSRQASYRNYVALGNAVMRDVDSQTFLGGHSSATYDLHAKVFEWWVVAFGLLGIRAESGKTEHQSLSSDAR